MFMKFPTHLRFRLSSAVALSLCSLGGFQSLQAAAVVYNIQTSNFDAQQTRIPSGGFAGSFNNTATEAGFYAHGGSGGTNETAFQTFTTTGTTSGAARALQAGDNYALTLYSGSNPFGFVGVYFDDNTSYTSYANYNASERTAVVLGPSGNWIIENNGTSVDTGIGAAVSITLGLTVTSSNTLNMAITNNNTSATTTYYDLVMKNAPGSTAKIQSTAYAVQNDRDTGASSNFYVKNGSLSNTGSVTVGGSNLSLTMSGVTTDGLAANSTTTASANALTKIGTGNITLTGANSYSGSTNVLNGTLQFNVNQAAGLTGGVNLGDTTGANGAQLAIGTAGVTLSNAITVRSGASGTKTISALNTTGTATFSGTVTMNDALTLNSNSGGALAFTGSTFALGSSQLSVIGANDTSIANAISGTGSISKQGAGTLTLSGASDYNGATAVTAGKLIVSGSISGSAVTVSAGATLASGANNTASVGALTLNSSSTALSTLAVGGTGSTGKLTAAGNVTLGTSGTGVQSAKLSMELGGTTAGGGYDQIALSSTSSTLNLSNVSLDGSLLNGFAPKIAANFGGTVTFDGDAFYLFVGVGSGKRTGTFANQSAADAFSGGLATITFGGQEFAISYSANFNGGVNSTFASGGNDIALMAIPEPQTWASLLGGAALLLYRGARRGKRRFSTAG